MKKQKGLFLSFEGLDGVGKTTQIRKIISYLTGKGYDVVLLREPGGTELGEEIRKLLFDNEKKPSNQWGELFLFLASRAELWEQKIKPALEEGKIVICDRFMDSTIAYQAYGRYLPISLVTQLHYLFLEKHLPDKTYWLDMDIDKIEARKANRREQNHFDEAQRSFKERVQKGYQYLERRYSHRILRIEADQPFLNVHVELKRDILRMIKKCDLKRGEKKL